MSESPITLDTTEGIASVVRIFALRLRELRDADPEDKAMGFVAKCLDAGRLSVPVSYVRIAALNARRDVRREWLFDQDRADAVADAVRERGALRYQADEPPTLVERLGPFLPHALRKLSAADRDLLTRRYGLDGKPGESVDKMRLFRARERLERHLRALAALKGVRP